MSRMIAPELVRRATTLAERPRALLGITGAPGSGKSTLAAGLCAALVAAGMPVALIGMDAFHLAHSALTERGLVEVKGAPRTFDAAGYVALLRRLREPGPDTVWAPEFRREIEDAVAGAVPVARDTRLVVTEGNYLLAAAAGWADIAGLLDDVWFLELPEQVRLERLTLRHMAFGRDRIAAAARARGVDQVNADLIAATKSRASLVVRGWRS